ncbi:MAG: HAMP domain-containing protein, partial [Planctomycetes bacterium]|nr:HAMP domain-containing protein [Planctomycetota bacterium]
MGLNAKLYGAIGAPSALAAIGCIILFTSGSEGATAGAALAGAAAVVGAAAMLFVTSSVIAPLDRFMRSARDISRGGLDLSRRLPEDEGEMAEVARALNAVIEETGRSLRTVAELADRVAVASNHVAQAATSITSSAQTQEKQAIEVATAMEEMTVTVNEVARNATQVADQASIGTELANTGADVVRKTIESMETIAASVRNSSATVEELGQRSAEIGQIIGVISDIADLTNLLSLNAAIEAARAGEHGRGFAVVADEVRALAQRTQESTEEIHHIIEAVQNGAKTAASGMDAGNEKTEHAVSLA